MVIGPTATNKTPPFYRGVLGTPFFEVANRGQNGIKDGVNHQAIP
jgi:hypothetical protein